MKDDMANCAVKRKKVTDKQLENSRAVVATGAEGILPAIVQVHVILEVESIAGMR